MIKESIAKSKIQYKIAYLRSCFLFLNTITYRFTIKPISRNHRLSINTPTRGKEKSPSDGHCQCEKEKDNHLLVCQQFLKESHAVTRLANERASFLKINDINDISFFGTSYCQHRCSIA
jgi:hypothetical protein